MLLFFINSILFSIYISYGQTDEEMYQAFIRNNPVTWKYKIDRIAASPITPNQYQEYAESLYGYIGWCIRDNKKDEAKYYLKRFKETIPNIPSSFYQSLYESVYMSFRIMLDDGSPLFCGPKAIKYSNKALEIDPENPSGYIQKGYILAQMPGIFGGSSEKALECFLKAQQLFENKKETKSNWIYIHLLCNIFDTYQVLGKKEKSLYYFNLIKEMEPDFFWLEFQKCNKIK